MRDDKKIALKDPPPPPGSYRVKIHRDIVSGLDNDKYTSFSGVCTNDTLSDRNALKSGLATGFYCRYYPPVKAG